MGIIEVCNNHTGKMEGIKSLSTSVLLNPNCKKNRTIPGSICSHCYANTLAQMYSALGARLERNTKELTSRFLTTQDLDYLKKELQNETIFRFEAFGDLNNEIQLRNYIRICKSFPEVKFALYTKMYKLVYDFFSKNKYCPDNLTLIISSLKLNKTVKIENFYKLGLFSDYQVKVFTVYDKNFIKSHPNLNINCGARSCNKCRLCYSHTPVTEVNEILKSDRESTTLYLELRDPVKKAKILDTVEKMLNKY